MIATKNRKSFNIFVYLNVYQPLNEIAYCLFHLRPQPAPT